MHLKINLSLNKNGRVITKTASCNDEPSEEELIAAVLHIYNEAKNDISKITNNRVFMTEEEMKDMGYKTMEIKKAK